METADPRIEAIVIEGGEHLATAPPRHRKRNETLYFAFRNTKLVVGLSVVLFFLVLAIVGPWLTVATPFVFG